MDDKDLNNLFDENSEEKTSEESLSAQEREALVDSLFDEGEEETAPEEEVGSSEKKRAEKEEKKRKKQEEKERKQKEKQEEKERKKKEKEQQLKDKQKAKEEAEEKKAAEKKEAAEKKTEEKREAEEKKAQEKREAEEKTAEEKKKHEPEEENVQEIPEDEEELSVKAEEKEKEKKQKKEKAEEPKEKKEFPQIEIELPHPKKSHVAIAVLVAILIALILFVAFHPMFRVRTMVISGNNVVTNEEISEATGLKYNAHLFAGISGNILDVLKMNYGKTEEKIKAENPYIKDIDISITLPSEVTIDVEERSKIAYVKTPDGYIALDTEGIVLELVSGDSSVDVMPVISGIVIDSAVLGKKAVIDDVENYQRAIIVLGAILQVDNQSDNDNYKMFANTSEIRILPSGYIFLSVYTPSKSLLRIMLNSTESITEDMTWLLYAINNNAFDSLPDGTLDMTGDEYIYREY